MTSTVRAASKTAKSGGGHLAGKQRPSGRAISPLMRKFRERYPQKTAVMLALLTGADIRHCERCLAGERDLGADFQAELLRSDFGRDALTVLMSNSRAAWWRGFRRQLEISELRRVQTEAQRRLEALERGDD